MAKFTGHRCDRPECPTVADNSDPSKHAAPEGWYILDPQAPDGKKFELCSAKCVRLFVSEREKAEKPERAPRAEGEHRMQAAHQGNMIRWHKAGSHDKEPRENCPMCEQLTAPVPETM